LIFGGKFYYFTVLVFGSASAPTVWGRFAAFAARSTAAVCRSLPVRLELYVDDPILVALGPPERAARSISLAILWLCLLGFPLAWHKSEGGPSIRWIGASFTFDGRLLHISLPAEKVAEVLDEIATFLSGPTASRRSLRSLTGKLNFFAGLVPIMRPFLRPLWALSSSDAPSGRLPPHLVHTKRVLDPLRWCRALLHAEHGPFRRTYRLDPFPSADLWCITTDACPWGFGAILSRYGKPLEWMADTLHTRDLDRFGATLGDSAHTTLWESLCILVALRLWGAYLPQGLALRSDSLSSLRALVRMDSPSPGINALLREVALIEGQSGSTWVSLTHIPGISNAWADALSRLGAPEPKSVPRELEGVRRRLLPPRGSRWWRAG
jgi:hypothetical protein